MTNDTSYHATLSQPGRCVQLRRAPSRTGEGTMICGIRVANETVLQLIQIFELIGWQTHHH